MTSRFEPLSLYVSIRLRLFLNIRELHVYLKNRIVTVGSYHSCFLVLLPDHFSTDQKLKHVIMDIVQRPFEQ